MSAFRISGGILLLLTALDMLFERRTLRREGQLTHVEKDPSVFPLATPLIAGPGALASMILLSGEVQRDFVGLLAVHLVMIAVLACVLGLFLISSKIEKFLGRTGRMVVTRLLGMLLSALSIQFIIDGMKGSGLLG
jgi:multiple antibiotic resistance protein